MFSKNDFGKTRTTFRFEGKKHILAMCFFYSIIKIIKENLFMGEKNNTGKENNARIKAYRL